MKILQQPVKVKRNQIIQVHFDKPTVVRLLSKNMFVKYKNGNKHTSQGGFYEESPVEFTVPYDGVWHAVIEKGSHFNPLDVTGHVKVLPPVVQESSYYIEDSEPTEALPENEHEESEEAVTSEYDEEDVTSDTDASEIENEHEDDGDEDDENKDN